MSTTPNPSCFVTTSWDDGHVLDHKFAQILGAYDLPATFYVAPENVELDPRDRLDKTGIRQLADRLELGAHTLHHLSLPSLSDGEAREEVRAGRHALEDVTGRVVDAFCYVGGQYRARHVQLVREEGFRLARTVRRHACAFGPAFELPTTMHAYRHWSDVVAVRRLTGADLRRFQQLYLAWDELAIHLFDSILRDGGVFHLWGHSWQLEARRDWGPLERVLEHIARRPAVTYVPNSGLPLDAG